MTKERAYSMGRIAALAARLVLLASLLVVATVGAAQSGGKDRVVELKDGGRVVLRVDGTMDHYDVAGIRIAMPEGTEMIAKGGNRLMMKGGALWREIIELAAGAYARASANPFDLGGTGERVIELNDGSRIAVRRDGTMQHYDATGLRLQMADGVVMTAKDGTPIMMNNGRLWGPNSNRDAPVSGK
jgi:hypothetical protein